MQAGMTMGRQSITNAGAQVPRGYLAKEFRPSFQSIPAESLISL